MTDILERLRAPPTHVGAKIPGIAVKRVGVNFESARTHPGRTRAKTGTALQPDLVRAVLLGVGFLRSAVQPVPRNGTCAELPDHAVTLGKDDGQPFERVQAIGLILRPSPFCINVARGWFCT